MKSKCVVLQSFSAYSDIWELALSSYRQYFTEKEDFDFYITTDAISPEMKDVVEGLGFKVFIYDKDITWGKSLKQVLSFILQKGYEHALFTFDDLVLTGRTHFSSIYNSDCFKKNDIEYVLLKQGYKNIFNTFQKAGCLKKVNVDNSYRGSLVFALINRSFMEKLLDVKDLDDYSAWQYELMIHKFLKSSDLYYSNKKVLKYANTIIKGSLDPIMMFKAKRSVKCEYRGNRKRFSLRNLLSFYIKTFLFRVTKFMLPETVFYKLRLLKNK